MCADLSHLETWTIIPWFKCFVLQHPSIVFQQLSFSLYPSCLLHTTTLVCPTCEHKCSIKFKMKKKLSKNYSRIFFSPFWFSLFFFGDKVRDLLNKFLIKKDKFLRLQTYSFTINSLHIAVWDSMTLSREFCGDVLHFSARWFDSLTKPLTFD